jgi:hypothetical protein
MVQLKRRKSDRTIASELCRRFGRIAVEKGFVTLEQVKQAMADQLDDDMNGRDHRMLGTILYDHGYLSESQIEMVLVELRRSL